MAFPYYTTQDNWEATLTLNNPTPNPLQAFITLYSLDGQPLVLPAQTVPAKKYLRLPLSNLISQARVNGHFKEGSLTVGFIGPMNGIGAQLTVADLRNGYSFDMEPPMGFKSSRLEGVWWSQNDKTSGQVMLCNTTTQPLNVELNVDWQASALTAPAISLAAHQTTVVYLDKLLKDVHVNNEGIGQGGLSITHNGPAGALIAHGFIQSKTGRYVSNLDFIDPAGEMSSVLEARGLMLGYPASTTVFPAPSYFTPVLALRNASATAQTATVTMQYTASGNSQATQLPAVTLAPHEVKMVNFSPVLQVLGNTPVDDAGLKIESSGEAGTLIAQLTSINNGKMCVDAPLATVGPKAAGSGNHPFDLSGDRQAVVHLKNVGDKLTLALLRIVYDGGEFSDSGEFSPELIPIKPGQTVAIDIRQLRDSQGQDIHGHRLPANLMQGQVRWFQHGKPSVIGRLVASSESLGVASSYACGEYCCSPSFLSLDITPSWGGIDGEVGDTYSFTATELAEIRCLLGSEPPYGPYDVTQYVTFSSSDSSIVSVSGANFDLIGTGDASISYSYSTYAETPTSSEPCSDGNCPDFACVPDGGGLIGDTAPVTVQEPQPHHVRVIVDQAGYPSGCTNTPVYVRQIQVQIVSEGNVDITHVDIPISESFTNLTNNTCGSGNPEESACSTLNVNAGKFIDTMTVHGGVPFGSFCNTGIDTNSGCGYTLTSLWMVCPGPSFGAADIWRYNGETRSNIIIVNGNPGPYMPWTPLFP